MKKTINPFALVFLLVFATFVIYVSKERSRVFVLHSYNTDFSWVKHIDEGIRRGFHDKPYHVQHYYMNTKNFPQKDYVKKSAINATRIIERWDPDVILAIDDNAQEWVAKNYIDHSGMDIVFAGINGSFKKYDYHKAKNVTGITENIPVNTVIEVLKHFFGEKPLRIGHICDDSPSSIIIQEYFKKFDWSPYKMDESILCTSFSQWKNAIAKAQNQYDLILFTHYHTIRDDKDPDNILKPAKVIEWTMKNSNLPGVGAFDFFVQDGGMMSIAVSPFEQGEVIAKSAIRIIEEKIQGSSIPVHINSHTLICLRESELKKHNIKVPSIYESFARATNMYFE